MGDEDPSNSTPLGEPDRLSPSNRGARMGVHKLPEVVQGRMLCVAHGCVIEDSLGLASVNGFAPTNAMELPSRVPRKRI